MVETFLLFAVFNFTIILDLLFNLRAADILKKTISSTVILQRGKTGRLNL